MESMNREDVERLLFFDQARQAAERDHKANPEDPMALTKWGGALLELSQFRQGTEAYGMIEEAIDKFQKALKIDEERHDALWCLGNAYTTQGFLSPDAPAAHALFGQAAECFEKAVGIAPTNETYKRSLEMTTKAPVLYQELQRQLIAGGHVPGAEGGEGAAASARSPTARQAAAAPGGISDFWYDAAGWMTLLALGFGVAFLAQRAQGPVPAGHPA